MINLKCENIYKQNYFNFKQIINNQPKIKTYYVLPMQNNVEMGNYGGKYVAPIQIKTQPKFENGFLNINFEFEIAGNFDLPENAFLCNVTFMNQIVKNVPIYLKNINNTSSPTTYTYEGNTRINLINEWTNSQIHNQQYELRITPFFNPQLMGQIKLVVGGGSFQEFENDLTNKCYFSSFYKLSNYFTQEELTKQNYENWIPIDYIFNYQNGLKPTVKNLIKPNYYFEPKENLMCLTKSLTSPWYTNARSTPDKEFLEPEIILTYQVINQPEKTIRYKYNLPNNQIMSEFNLGFKTIYDFDKHEIKIVSNLSHGTNGLFFPEPTAFNLKYIFKDKQNFGCYYTGNIQGKFVNNILDKNVINVSIKPLNNQVNGNWNLINDEK